MLPTLSQKEEVSFVEKGRRIQRKDDLTTCIQKTYRDINLILCFYFLIYCFPCYLDSLEHMLNFKWRLYSFFKARYMLLSFLGIFWILMSSSHTKTHIGLREYFQHDINLNYAWLLSNLKQEVFSREGVLHLALIYFTILDCGWIKNVSCMLGIKMNCIGNERFGCTGKV